MSTHHITVAHPHGTYVRIWFSYTPGRPAVMYLRNGDPGYPAEPAEVERRHEPMLRVRRIAEHHRRRVSAQPAVREVGLCRRHRHPRANGCGDGPPPRRHGLPARAAGAERRA